MERLSSDVERVRARYDVVGRRWAYGAVSVLGFSGLEPILRERAVLRLGLRLGDRVLDVACGRGGNVRHLERAVGPSGRIVGIDYSPTMLAGATRLVRARGWENVELVRGDVSEMDFREAFDGVLCTNAMSVIPRWEDAIRRMAVAARPSGRIAILDGRLLTGAGRVWNPYIRLFAHVVAADLGRDIPGACRAVLSDVEEEALLGGSYFVVSGRPRVP
ncbi:MAG: hypothetical protein A3K59_08135 [Euryarchaeota archaeon RBG_19FT_COMBO_69_17]|nr:MAG: hypothetical protein A3K59_08135 [Euryarchaeota archaeon RBG_19FT_COMBO_69_17]